MSDLKHIAIILDGNGRWAKAKGMPRTYGHAVGAKNVEVIMRAAKKLGVEYMTLYAFSTENWKRQQSEVEAIMRLLSEYLKSFRKLTKEDHVKFKLIGDITGIPPYLQKEIKSAEEESKDFDEFYLNMAINYGGRDEIVRAVKRAAKDTNVSIDELTAETFGSYLDTGGYPDPDLLIRPGGEKRISNFLLWQLAYTEFVFTDVYWPDFDEEELKRCVDIYHERNRRYGNV